MCKRYIGGPHGQSGVVFDRNESLPDYYLLRFPGGNSRFCVCERDSIQQECSLRSRHINDLSFIFSVFERGAAAVGLDFLSHIFWDKYLEFEEKKEAYDRIVKILERIIRIPMHQYARFFEKYQQLSATRPVKELLNPETYVEYESEIRAQPLQSEPVSENEDQPATSAQVSEKTDEQVEAEIRARIHQINVDVYMRTQEETNKRWVFEAEIKRPYFHVKPMDEPQLSNWRRYLDFEEEANDEHRVQVLFERCLVACALHEEFWQRYGKWLQSKNRKLDALGVFARATSVFIPANRPSIRLAYALLQEEQGQIEEARTLYKNLLEAVPGHVETLVKYAHFERRQNSGDVTEIFASNIVSPLLDERTKAFLTVQYANYLWHNQLSVEKARDIYEQASSKYLDNKYFWLNYLNFELAQNDNGAEQNIIDVFELIRNTATIPVDTLRDINLRYIDFLAERGTSVSLLNKIESEVGALSTAAASQLATPAVSKKRAAEETYNQPTKQARFDSPAAQHAGVATSPQASAQPYYSNQPTQQYQYPTVAGAAQPYAYQYQQYGAAAAAAAPVIPTAGAWDYSQQTTATSAYQ
ncbi:hypothetical protein BC938DRAFT_471896 [Jimgerdemannia flammicorona]|uniref:Suppressor of forked domain-containing protein n=1 Tax=Jimgerdemannia flammicorona TaxID=994334 RepID=A0A433Q757_9FUNG|nr:hypothetical protein BC938DRAFT_471896 [Jimgerdemannia flammicorona]